MLDITTLPTTDDELRTWLRPLGLPDEGSPFVDAAGSFRFDPSQGWPTRWHPTPRLADWREGRDTRYEGRETEEHARKAIEAGRLPGHLADHDSVREWFKDNSGNVYLQLPALRTPDGHTPVLFFDHDRPWELTVRARTLVELYAREALVVWMQRHGRDRALRALVEGAVAIDPRSLQAVGDVLEDGWRAAVGLPANPDRAPRPRPVRDPLRGRTLERHTTLAAFEPAYTRRFIRARAVDADALGDVLHPLAWWRLGVFTDLDDGLRNLMARTLSLASQPAAERTEARATQALLDAAQFLEGLLQKGELRLAPHQTPTDLLRTAVREALRRLTGERLFFGELPDDDGVRLLDTIPPMKRFHEGWSGIVAEEVLAQGDVVAFRRAEQLLSKVTLMKNTVYNLLRRCGDDHLDALTERLPDLLPADQEMVLHALDAFPRHPGVLALYDHVLADSPYDTVKRSVTRYRDRVASGVMSSGWER